MNPLKHPVRWLAINFLTLFLVVILSAALHPTESAPASGTEPSSQLPVSSEIPAQDTPTPDLAPAPTPQSYQGPDAFILCDAASGETFSVDATDFLAANLACEMDLASPEEALKAQVVASYTYYTRLAHTGQSISCDPGSWLVYAPDSAMRERWGDSYNGWRAVMDRVVESVAGQLLTYEGEPILATYFAISPGSTEAVENVWSPGAGADHPYLQAVASPGDLFSDGYLSTADFTEGELRAALENSFEVTLTGPAAEWISDVEYTPSGMVKRASVGGVEATGTQLRTALNLRSACFEWNVDSAGTAHFTVKGWGHGVGMSQAGAVFMAKRGSDYQEILAHYYPGAELT